MNYLHGLWLLTLYAAVGEIPVAKEKVFHRPGIAHNDFQRQPSGWIRQ